MSEIAEATTQIVKFAARDPEHEGETVSTLSTAMFRMPAGLHARSEDFMVASESRREGIGEALVRAAPETACDAGACIAD